ncbi:MAG: hypothetical protein K1060chlam1_00696 [Candidatus Anoxychlamydiales bacterium]|nr:hypothetical protein [Candidatus Anoxychlamydiales bacterium]
MASAISEKLSKVPYKVAPIAYASILAINYLSGGEMTMLKLSSLAVIIGGFAGSIISAKSFQQHPSENALKDLKAGAEAGASIGLIFLGILPSLLYYTR